MTRLFFYGTLMSDGSRGHALRGLAVPVGPATITGDLYDVGCFPALVPGGGRVVGEVWEVLPGCEVEALDQTDGIEGFDQFAPARSLYIRRPVRARLADGSLTVVEVYEWNRSTRGMIRIADGDWRSYRNRDDLPMEVA
jgi:gamma-glutamylcyclotransferase (GGCT)/AIG2-like uncharacterized protein YtfP